MFDRDLQAEILERNSGFFEWARRQPIKPVEVPIKLSQYEDPIGTVRLADLSAEALERYRSKAGIAEPVGSEEFNRRLLRQGLLVAEGGRVVPSGFGVLLFGEHPRESVNHAGLLARAELPDGSTARREFGEALVLIPGLLEEWLRTVLPSTIDRSRMERQEHVDLPFEMIRESVVNALVHRDYDLVGQKCQLVLDASTIRVKSPGGPISPISLADLNSLSAPMKSRNPQLHYVFARMGLAEEQGLGLEKSLKQKALEVGLPLPKFAMEGEYLVLTVFRNRQAARTTLSSSVQGRLTKSEALGWEWLSTRERVTTAEYERAMGVPNRTAKNHIKKLVDLSLLRRKGKGPATYYEVVRGQ